MSNTFAIIPSDEFAVRMPVDKMVDIVAGLVGMQEDPEGRQLALDCLDRAADHLNMAGVYLFNQKNYEVTPDMMTVGENTFLLPDDFAWPLPRPTIIGTDGRIVGEMVWLDWARFTYAQKDDVPRTTKPPIYLSILSLSEGRAYFWPEASTESLAGMSKMNIPYLTRVVRPSQSDVVWIPSEIREALIAGGEAFIMRFRQKENTGAWVPFWNQFRRTIQGAKGAANRVQSRASNSWARPGSGVL